jgi:hypothetical protein
VKVVFFADSIFRQMSPLEMRNKANECDALANTLPLVAQPHLLFQAADHWRLLADQQEKAQREWRLICRPTSVVSLPA